MAVAADEELITINEACRQLRRQGLPLMPATLTLLVQLGFIPYRRRPAGLHGLRVEDVNRFMSGSARKERVVKTNE